MGILGIKIRQFQRYIKTIHERDKEAWLNVTRTQLEPELLRLKKSLEKTHRIADDEAEKEGKTTEEILAARQAADDARLSIVQLITEGPDYVKHIDEYVQE